MEELKFDRSAVTGLDWEADPILRFPDVPEIVMDLIDRPDRAPVGRRKPTAGDRSLGDRQRGVRRHGVRFRSVPFTPNKVLAGLRRRLARHQTLGEGDMSAQGRELLAALRNFEKGKLVSARDAVQLIQDGDTLATSGFVGIGFPENIAVALEARFRESSQRDPDGIGRPEGLTLVYAAGQATARTRPQSPRVQGTRCGA